MEYLKIKEQKFLIIKNYKEALENSNLEEKFTEYFESYDYIVGDWSYGKLRLKGFNEKTNPNFKKINDKENIKEYLKNYCAYECKYFILKKEQN